jgi:peptidoglycan/xylan/chitin deacetylase (PgdA/CDA1 family)
MSSHNPSRPDGVTPEIGSHPGWPLVLYFHHVRDDIEHYTVLRPDDFVFALDLLRHWFRPMEPRDLVTPSTWPNEPTCLLTFDDGYRDVWDHAVPALEQRDWRVVIFVSTKPVGTIEKHPKRGLLEHMTWNQLRELRANGHIVASHGHTHRDMSLLSREAVCTEIETARTHIIRELGPGPVLLAYPYGKQPSAIKALASTLPSLCFGSVSAPPAPWTECPWLIRRTFLPTGTVERWPGMVERWRRQWEGISSP